MAEPVKRIYIYNAHAYGFSGAIDRPFSHAKQVHAGSALPTTGGFESAGREFSSARMLLVHSVSFARERKQERQG